MKNIIILACVILLIACNSKSKSQYQKEIDAVEQNLKPYNPLSAVDTNNLSLYLTFEVVNGQILPNPRSAQLAAVKMGTPATAGSFRVSTLDANKKAIYTHIMESPLLLRSCDEAGTVQIKRLTKGDFSVSVPYNPNIAFVRLEDESNKETRPVEVDVPTLLKMMQDSVPRRQ